MEEKIPNWNISDLYSRSWEIIKKNKILWLFGMALVTFGSNGSSGSNSSVDDPSSLLKLFQNNSTAIDSLKNILISVPVWLYVLLAFGVILLVLINIVLSFIYQSWVNGSLIAGVYTASTNQKPTIWQSSSQAFAALKGLVWLSIVPLLVFILAAAAVFGGLAFFILVVPSLKILWFVLIFIAGVVGLIIGLIGLGLAPIWASRRIVLEYKPAQQAFLSSVKIARKKFWRMLGLGSINMLVSVAVTLALTLPVILIVGAAFFGVIFGNPNPTTVSILIGVGVILFLAFMIAYTILAGVLNAFKASVWTLAYLVIKGGFSE